jgi:uncharacterized membrane-anchored protein YhcB (DUF1043 family)
MQDQLSAAAQTALQPFMKLAQSNMELLTKFSASPEVMSEAMNSTQALMRQAQESATKLAQSSAFMSMMQGMAKNYTEFLTELSHGAMGMMTQGQAAMMQQGKALTEKVTSAADGRVRRVA